MSELKRYEPESSTICGGEYENCKVYMAEYEDGRFVKLKDVLLLAQPPIFDPPSSPGWISVEDRLPKNPTGALIYRDEGVSEALFMNGIWEYFGEEVCPTHWMPLPEAPS